MSNKSELDQLTPEAYKEWLQNQISEGYEDKSALDCIHVLVEDKRYDEKTGRRLSEPEVKVHSIAAWGADTAHGMQDYYRRFGFATTVMYDPRAKKAAINSSNAIEPDDAEKADVEPKAARGRRPKGE